MAGNSQARYMFARPEEGFDKDDPAVKQMIKDFYDPANRPRHTLDPRGERSDPLDDRIKEKLAEFERVVGRRPTEEEADRITETMTRCSGWLEGLKVDVAGKKEVPIAFFNRLVQDYEETIEWVAKDRVHFDAKYIQMILERDDRIKELESQLKEKEKDTLKQQSAVIDQLKHENASVKKERDIIKEIMKRRDEANNKLRQERDDLQKQLKDLMDREEDLQKRLQKCEDRGRRLEADLEAEKSKPESSAYGKGTSSESNTNQRDIQRELDTITERLRNLDLQSNNLSSLLGRTQDNVDRLEKQLARANEESAISRREMEDLKTQHSKTTRQIKSLEAQAARTVHVAETGQEAALGDDHGRRVLDEATMALGTVAEVRKCLADLRTLLSP